MHLGQSATASETVVALAIAAEIFYLPKLAQEIKIGAESAARRETP